MNIADILGLGPKPPPTIDAARVTTHRLGHDADIPTKEQDMSRATDVADAIAKLGGRATRQDLQDATGLEGKQMENGLTLAKAAGLIVREGKDYVLTNTGSNGTSEATAKPVKTASQKAAPAKKKPAGSAKKEAPAPWPAAPKAKKKPRVAAASATTKSVALTAAGKSSSTLDRHRPAAPEVYYLLAGGVLIVDGSERIQLTQAQYIAVLNANEGKKVAA